TGLVADLRDAVSFLRRCDLRLAVRALLGQRVNVGEREVDFRERREHGAAVGDKLELLACLCTLEVRVALAAIKDRMADRPAYAPGRRGWIEEILERRACDARRGREANRGEQGGARRIEIRRGAAERCLGARDIGAAR